MREFSEKMKETAWELKAHFGGYGVPDQAVDMLVTGADRIAELEVALQDTANALALATQFPQGEEFEQQEFCLAAVKTARAVLSRPLQVEGGGE